MEGHRLGGIPFLAFATMALFCPAAKECDEAIVIVSFSCACREAHCRPAITPGRVADFSLRFEQMLPLVLWLTIPISVLALNSTSASDDEYCVMCKKMMADCRRLFDDDFSSVHEEQLMLTTTSLCGKYYIGFEEVICRILCQVNASDLLDALRDDVSIVTICEKGGVCRPEGSTAIL
ncbi:hypothetical protein Q1695_008424 [Nippostrongylus brasiliensis]|nr:hypothetical protein Q1695_008424 [Nippostrongylus brasiliensis]